MEIGRSIVGQEYLVFLLFNVSSITVHCLLSLVHKKAENINKQTHTITTQNERNFDYQRKERELALFVGSRWIDFALFVKFHTSVSNTRSTNATDNEDDEENDCDDCIQIVIVRGVD